MCQTIRFKPYYMGEIIWMISYIHIYDYSGLNDIFESGSLLYLWYKSQGQCVLSDRQITVFIIKYSKSTKAYYFDVTQS